MLSLLLLVGFVVFVAHQFRWSRLGYLNGLLSLPIIGNAHTFLGLERREDQFLEWREQNGSIYTYWLGLMKDVTVNNYKTMQKMFVQEDEKCADRTALETFDGVTRRRIYGTIDAYLLGQAKLEKMEVQGHCFTRRQLRNVCFDLWFAGEETTSTTATWAFALLIRYPEVRQKLHEELDRDIGSDPLITMPDKNALRDTNSVIMEIQRCANIAGQNISRKTTCKVEVGDCLLSKETVFVEPKKFNFDWFINENRKLKSCDDLTPFGLNEMVYLGSFMSITRSHLMVLAGSMARLKLFLLIANLCNAYKVSEQDSVWTRKFFQFFPDEKEPTLRKMAGEASLFTVVYKCRVQQRHQ
ncbi:(pine wood nematode) hypothetical protein [Aphelenchoides besseyi]|nr:(pine wood nematode) hypothetical protein [Aphelenchoides besseyi]